MTPAEYGRKLADTTPPLPNAVIEEAARVYADWLIEQAPPLIPRVVA